MIQAGDTTAQVKAAIGELVDTSSFSTWGDARTALNALAIDWGYPTFADGEAGGSVRTKINALTSWVPEGAAFAADFLNQRYYRTAEPPVLRASPAYAQDLAGVYQSFSNNQLRLTDAGLYVPEPMSTRLTSYPKEVAASWIAVSSNISALAGTALGIFNGAARVASTGNDWNRAQPGTISLISGTAYGFAALLSTGTSGRARIVLRDNTNATESRRAGTLSGGMVDTNNGAGIISAFTVSEDAPGLFWVKGTFTPTASGVFQFSIGPDTATVGADVIIWGGWVESNPTASSPILASPSISGVLRAAETITIPAPAGTYDLHLLLDDASEHVIPGFQNGDALPLTLPQGKFITSYWGIAA